MTLVLPRRFAAAATNLLTMKRSIVRSGCFRRCMGLNCAGRKSWRAGLGWKGVQLDGKWYCLPCFERTMLDTLSRLRSSSRQPRVHHRIPLGLIMLARGQIDAAQLQLALATQKAAGTRKFGAWLLELGFSTEQQITGALARQWSCPMLSESISPHPSLLPLLPLPLEESFGMVPVHYIENSRVLHVAFAGPIDYTMLYAIQQLLGCGTVPCLATASLLREALDRARSISRPSDLVFETCTGNLEMSRITANYVSRLGADDVRIVNCGGYVWVRMQCGSAAINLLFHNRQNGQRAFPV